VKNSRVLQLVAALALVSVLALLFGAHPAGAPSPLPYSDIAAGLTAVDNSSVAWGDYDSDGELDILLTGSKGSGVDELWKNNGGSFSKDATAGTHLTQNENVVYYSSAAWADYDSDGDLDLLVTGMNNSLVPITKIFKNDGGVFTEDTTADAGLPGVYHGSVAWGDYNADGKPDILLTGNNGSDVSPAPVSKIYKNNGDGTFSEVTGTGLAQVRYGSVAWGDYNSDGHPDILLTGQTGSTQVSKIYKNDGDGTFSEDTTAESGLTPVSDSSVAWGDYNSDGYPDILLTGFSSSGSVSKIYENNGNGTFSEDTIADSALSAVSYGSVAWGDYNADGRLDILLTGYSSSGRVAKIYENNGNGTFSEDSADSALTGVDWSSVAWGDFGEVGGVTPTGTPDGRLDILLTGDNGSPRVSSVYERSTSITETNEPPSAPSGLSVSFASGIETLSWSAATDSEQSGTPNGLTYNVRVGTTAGASDVVSPLALPNGTRLLPQYGNAGERTSYKLSGLTPGTTYYWSAQAVDSGFAGSPFATEGTFTVPPATFAFSSAGYSVGEGDGTATVTINRTGSTAPASVHFATANGTATAGSDYTDASQTVSFANGETSKTVSIPITDDSSIEPSETVQLSLSSPSTGATLGSPSTATLTITDNDRAFAFSLATYSVNENGGSANVTINRTGLTSGTDSVHFATANGSAQAGSDYTAVNQTVTFASGETAKTVSVPITNDTAHEASETVLLSLSSPSSGATLGSPSTAILTITDNDVAPPPPAKASGKIASCKLAKASFTAAQAGKVKLTCKFSPKSKLFKWVLSRKKGTKWVLVKSVRKTGSFKTYAITIKKLFAGKPVKRGTYRLKLSADKNSKTLGFRVT